MGGLVKNKVTFDFSSFIAERVPPATATATTGWDPRGRPKYDFGTGFPDPDSFPAEGLHEALGQALKERGREMVLYPDPKGFLEFREFIVDKLHRERGIVVEPDQVLVTGGSGVALAIFTQLLSNPGDTLITEEFTYPGTLSVMRNLKANIVGVSGDEEGMRPDVLDETIRNLKSKGIHPKFVYTIPSFQNPTGTDMSVQRRHDILAVAQNHGVPIFEDDAYEDLRFEGDRTPSIHSYDDTKMTLYCGTFSKIIAPGMRIAYLVVPPELISQTNFLNWGRPTSHFAALATYYYLRDHMDEHVAEVNDILLAKRDTMIGALGEFMDPKVVYNRPAGGMYLWAQLPEGISVASVAGKARERGVAYLPGPNFSPTGEGENYLRLCFGYADHEGIRDGIALLSQIFTEEGLLG